MHKIRQKNYYLCGEKMLSFRPTGEISCKRQKKCPANKNRFLPLVEMTKSTQNYQFQIFFLILFYTISLQILSIFFTLMLPLCNIAGVLLQRNNNLKN